MSKDMMIVKKDKSGNLTLMDITKFTQEEIKWITADAKPNEIAYINNCVLEFLERELMKNRARLRWLQEQESEASK